MKSRFIELLLSTGREGMPGLINYMEQDGFFTAPCSTQHHLSKEGGLMEHSLNVYETMVRFYNGQSEFTSNGCAVIITSLLHDLGKMGQYRKPGYIPNILKSGQLSAAKPYETNKDLLYIPHEVRSIHIASQFINLTEEESWAILMHNGLYGDFKYAIPGKETPLYLLLHAADMWASRVIEKEET